MASDHPLFRVSADPAADYHLLLLLPKDQGRTGATNALRIIIVGETSVTHGDLRAFIPKLFADASLEDWHQGQDFSTAGKLAIWSELILPPMVLGPAADRLRLPVAAGFHFTYHLWFSAHHYALPLGIAARHGAFDFLRDASARSFDLGARQWQSIPPVFWTLVSSSGPDDGQAVTREQLACFDFLLDIRGTAPDRSADGGASSRCLACEWAPSIRQLDHPVRLPIRARWTARCRRGVICTHCCKGCVAYDPPFRDRAGPVKLSGPDPRSTLCRLVYAARYAPEYLGADEPWSIPTLVDLCLLQQATAAISASGLLCRWRDDQPVAGSVPASTPVRALSLGPMLTPVPIRQRPASWARLPASLQDELSCSLFDLPLIAALRRGWMEGTLAPGLPLRLERGVRFPRVHFG